jgi:FkbH-like protein
VKRLSEKLNKHLVGSSKILLVHSALHRINVFADPDIGTVSMLIDDLVRQGYTLVVPSFTFKFCSTGLFDWINDRSETGILADICWKKPNSLRTKHPIYSTIILGDRRQDLNAASVETCFGKDSLVERLYKEGARVIMLGAEWKACTFFHFCEEKANVPYRSYKDFTGKLIIQNETHPINTKMYVRHDVRVKNDFSDLIAKIQKCSSYRCSETPWQIESVDLQDIDQIVSGKIAQNPYYLANKKTIPSGLPKTKKKTTKQVSILIFSSGSTELFGQKLRDLWPNYFPETNLALSVIEYWNIPQLEEFLQKSEKGVDYDLIFVDTGALDLSGEVIMRGSEGASSGNVGKSLELVLGILRTHGDGSQIAINLVSRSAIDWELVDSSVSKTIEKHAVLQKHNSLIVDLVKDMPNGFAIDTDALKARTMTETFDNRLYGIARSHYSRSLIDVMVRKWCGIALATKGQSIRLLILDLDNTLWGGVLAEAGIKGIKLGGDFPGVLYKRFQQYLFELNKSGLILALSSKNDYEEALYAVNNHPEMVLREEEFSAMRINWESKVDNIHSIAEELGLGLSNIGFADDNRVECARIREEIPEIHVFDIGSDPSSFISTLDSSPYLEILHGGQQARNRKSSYTVRKKILQEKATHSDSEEFISSLELEIFLDPVDQFNIQRVHELFAKTNQFNSTTKKYSLSEIQEEIGKRLIVIGSADRFSTRETIGVLEVDWASLESTPNVIVESWLMSCRILGRGLEEELFCWLNRKALEKAKSSVLWKFQLTGRNQPVHKLYKRLCDHSNGSFVSEPKQWVGKRQVAKIYDNAS